jgi:hypothetical protein
MLDEHLVVTGYGSGDNTYYIKHFMTKDKKKNAVQALGHLSC